MENLNLDKFEPKKEELMALADQYKDLTIQGILDKEGYAKVREARIELKNTRVAITKLGKGLREEALAFQKAVIAKEKEYIEIITPVEEKLQTEEDNYNKLIEIQKRKLQLTARYAAIEGLADMSEEAILDLDDTEFATLIVRLKEEKMVAERQKLEAEKAEFEQKQREAEAEAQRQKDIADAAEKARQEEKEEAEKLRKNEEYKKFLEDNNYNELTDKIEKDGNQFTIYRAIARITIQ